MRIMLNLVDVSGAHQTPNYCSNMAAIQLLICEMMHAVRI